MSLNVANCSRCGKIYMKNKVNEVCPACAKEFEEMYDQAARYLRDNRGATIQQLSDDTGIPFRQIVRFIREGRISIATAPNIAYPCESCGAPMREGNICVDCRKKLTREYQNLQEDTDRRELQRRTEGTGSYNIHDQKNKNPFPGK